MSQQQHKSCDKDYMKQNNFFNIQFFLYDFISQFSLEEKRTNIS